uniref:Uncharacterized protein n=1 Tax=Opuntia streptacantha TaxID=393608 RepID=A0A7C9FL51_OPUST
MSSSTLAHCLLSIWRSPVLKLLVAEFSLGKAYSGVPDTSNHILRVWQVLVFSQPLYYKKKPILWPIFSLFDERVVAYASSNEDIFMARIILLDILSHASP